MDISQQLAALKKEPGFAEHVGMVLVHNGVVRAWSRGDGSPVTRIRVQVDWQCLERIRQEAEQMPGIFKVIAHAFEGEFRPGDDLLFLVVAGDIREHVKKTLGILLDRVKAEAIHKEEFS